MQGHFSGQTGTEAAEVMRPLSIQAEPVMETAIDRFDDLTKTRQPAAPGARPRALTIALGGTDHLGAVGVPPLGMPRDALKALIGHVRPLGGGTDTGQARVRPMPHRQQGLGQGLVVGTGGGIAKTGDPPDGVARQQQGSVLKLAIIYLSLK